MTTIPTKHLLAGNYHSAMPTHTAKPRFDGLFGPNHVELMYNARELGERYSQAGNLAQAEIEFAKALEHSRKVYRGKNKDQLATPLSALGHIKAKLGKTEEALQLYTEAYTLVNPTTTQAKDILGAIGQIHLKAGRYAEAEVGLRAFYDRYAGFPDTLQHNRAQEDLASALANQDKQAELIELLQDPYKKLLKTWKMEKPDVQALRERMNTQIRQIHQHYLEMMITLSDRMKAASQRLQFHNQHPVAKLLEDQLKPVTAFKDELQGLVGRNLTTTG